MTEIQFLPYTGNPGIGLIAPGFKYIVKINGCLTGIIVSEPASIDTEEEIMRITLDTIASKLGVQPECITLNFTNAWNLRKTVN